MLLPMKKLITLLITAAFLWPFSSFAIQEVKRTGKIETDEYGGYSDAQRDHHVRRKKQTEEKMKGGYYDGAYHSKSEEFKQGEWQFVDSAGKGSKQTKKYKKVKEKDVEATKTTKAKGK